MATLQERIKERRFYSGFTLLEVAEQLGVKEATMQRYESGEIKNIKHDTIVEMAKIFRCTPQYLMGWSDMIVEPDNIKDINIFLQPKMFQKDSDIEFRNIADNYNLLNKEGKKKLLDYSNDLVSSGNYSDTVTITEVARTANNQKSIKATQTTLEELSIFDTAPQSDEDL